MVSGFDSQIGLFEVHVHEKDPLYLCRFGNSVQQFSTTSGLDKSSA